MLAQKASRGRGAAASTAPLKELGDHPDGGAMQVMAGRYGPYVKWGKVFATLPKDTEPESVTFDQAVEWANEKAAKGGKGKVKPKAAAKPKTVAKAKAPAKAKAKAPAKAKAAAKPKAATKPKAAKTAAN